MRSVFLSVVIFFSFSGLLFVNAQDLEKIRKKVELEVKEKAEQLDSEIKEKIESKIEKELDNDIEEDDDFDNEEDKQGDGLGDRDNDDASADEEKKEGKEQAADVGFEKSLRFGFRSGLHVGDFRTRDDKGDVTVGFKPTFYAAALFENSFPEEKLKFQTEISYAHFGSYDYAKERESGKILENTGWKFSQISIPFMLKGEIFKNFYLNGGGYLALLISPLRYDGDVFDFGVLLGMEYTVFKSLFIDARWLSGWVDLVSDIQYEYYPNKVLQVGLGWKF